MTKAISIQLMLKLNLLVSVTPVVDFKVEKIWEDSMDSIPSPLPSVKIQIISGKVYLR